MQHLFYADLGLWRLLWLVGSWENTEKAMSLAATWRWLKAFVCGGLMHGIKGSIMLMHTDAFLNNNDNNATAA